VGFGAVNKITQAHDAGRYWLTGFRKAVSAAATTTSGWIDYSYFPGTPTANFYASSPLTAARMATDDPLNPIPGIYVPKVDAGQTQHLLHLTLMTQASGATSTANARQSIYLCDYLLYYPFVDTDAVGEVQAMTNVQTIPRYAHGQVIAIAQSAAVTVGQFTMTYTNQDGTPGRVSQNHFTLGSITGGGQIAATQQSGAGFSPFLHLQAGDYGVQSIQDVTFTAPGGGLIALAIVKPLLHHTATQECRVSTGTVDSFGSADEYISLVHQAGAPEIKNGAVINLLAQGHAGSLASSVLVGTLETVWN
jgi:hypothetical protein